ncbi:YihY/virulence factor BrkB family protein [Lachnospiraceae bacterium 62-35]
MISFIVLCKQIADKFIRDEMTVYAAQASFFILLSFFPFIMVLVTLLQFIPQLSEDMLVTVLTALIPNVSRIRPLIEGVVSDLYIHSPGTILWITVLTALWSASKGMMSMERGLNRIWGTNEKRGYIRTRIICTGYTLVFLLMCIMSLLLLVFGTAIQNFIVHTIPIISGITQTILNIRTIFAVALLVLSFTTLYAVVPRKKLKIKPQLPGALFSSLGWILFSFGFSIYFNQFSRFSYTYGSLTAIVLLMLWLYFCICILFAGAEINYFYVSYKNGAFHFHDFEDC